MAAIKKFARWYVLIALLIATAGVWRAAFFVEARRGRTLLHIFDVGQGDALLIEAPGGNQILIDGGPDASVLAKLGKVMPFWDRSIDLVILTHPHADHVDGLLEILKRYRVGMILESGVNHSIAEYALWHAEIAARHIPHVVATRGQVIHLGGGARLDVLTPFESWVNASPQNVHDATVVTEIHFASSTALLMGDAEAPLEHKLVLGGLGPVDVLKVGHHGSKTSTSEEFLNVARPRLAVISVGKKNRYGHPTRLILDRLLRYGVTIYRTDRDGDVTLTSDGTTFTYVP